MNSNILSHEQKLKIEENKRKALEKRLQNQNVQTQIEENKRKALEKLKQQELKNHAKPPSVPQSSGCGSKSGGSFQTAQSLPCGSNSAAPAKAPTLSAGRGRPQSMLGRAGPSSVVMQKSGNSGSMKGKGNGLLTGIGNKTFYGAPSKPVIGQCVLTSRDRFQVKMQFCQPVIEVFKTIPSRMYGECLCTCAMQTISVSLSSFQ